MFLTNYTLFITIYLIASFISFIFDKYKLIYKISIVDDYYLIYLKTYKLVLTNLFLITPIPLYFITLNLNYLNRDLNIYLLLPEFILLYLLTDFLFYITHRLFHHPKFYKFHKIHHQITTPIGFTAIYAHPIEYIFGNILPVALPLLILSSNELIVYIWTFLSIIETVIKAHGGYLNFSEYHDTHHKLYKYNYGTSEIWDTIFYTRL